MKLIFLIKRLSTGIYGGNRNLLGFNVYNKYIDYYIDTDHVRSVKKREPEWKRISIKKLK